MIDRKWIVRMAVRAFREGRVKDLGGLWSNAKLVTLWCVALELEMDREREFITSLELMAIKRGQNEQST